MPVIQLNERPFRATETPGSKTGDPRHKGYYSFYPGETWTPNVNLYETDDSYYVCVDLAGVEKSKIDVEVVDQKMTLKGNRCVPTCDEIGGDDLTTKRCRIHLMEIDHGAFSRTVELPEDVEKEIINATYHNGMLWIELPKKKEEA